MKTGMRFFDTEKKKTGVRAALLFAAALFVLFLWGCGQTERAANPEPMMTSVPFQVNGVPVPTESAPESKETDENENPAERKQSLPAGEKLTVTFLDVGQADAALIECGGESLLIDGGNADDSSLIVAVLREHYISRLKAVIATHPDEDHIGGLAGALKECAVDTLYSSVYTYDSEPFQYVLKYAKKQKREITVPLPGDSFSVGGALITFLGPLSPGKDTNDGSLVCRVLFGSTAFLFMGDAGDAEETEILESGRALGADVLKVSHHGSATATSNAFLEAVDPAYGVVSVGKNNRYGLPAKRTLDRLTDAGTVILRTDLMGDIVFESDGTSLTLAVERLASPAETAETQQEAVQRTVPEGVAYVGNTNSKKFHLPGCNSLPAERNRCYFDSREEAVAAGYEPCGRCKP